jgi:hypothetical protein
VRTPDAGRRLADEQAALRRVATLVAGGARPAEVFTAVADELGHLIGAEATFVSRVDLSGADSPGVPAPGASGERAGPEGYITVVGSYGRIRDEVDAETAGGMLRVRVHDDGIGGATPARGSGLLGLKDRIEALGGTFSVHSPAGRGTTVSCQLPVNADGEQ